jgi:outer membrane receptor protein involved in Fe transport
MTHVQLSTPRLSALATTISGVLGSNLLIAPAEAQEPALEEITVTGSRIVRRDLDAPSPIMTVDTARLEQSSTLSIESVLNQMPQFVPAGTQFVSGGQGSPTGTLGIASVNLRGIGTNRTLVLVDGRRPQPSNAALVVDVNSIPSAAIERVETITGGASAVYGPDALAGVVNFVLKDNFEGIEMDFQQSMTQESDGEESRFTTLFGMNSADGRGNMMLGLEVFDRSAVWQRDREFYRNGWYEPGTNAGGFILAPGFSFAGPNNRPDQAQVNAIWAQYHPGVTPPVVGWDPVAGPLPGAVHEIYFNSNGVPFIIPGARGFTGPFTTSAGNQTQDLGDGIWGMRINPNGNLGQVWEGNLASTPQERNSIFGRARYDLADNLTAFAQLSFTNNTVSTNQATISPAITVWQAHVPSDGRPLPPALQALLNARPDPTEEWRLFRGIDFWQEAASVENSNNVYQFTAGLEGRFGDDDWTWEAYASTGETDTRNDYNNLPSLQRWRWMNALPLFGAGDATGLPGQPGNTIGQAGVPPVNAGSSAGHHVFAREYVLDCTSGLPVFGGFANLSPDCLDSINSRSRASSMLTQDVAEFNVQGPIAEMRSGELRVAAGASYRENTFRFEPLNDNRVVSDHPVGLFVSDNTYGEMEVKELYGELLVPVTSRLDVELGYRYSDFNTAAGSVDTWKALFDYAVTDAVNFRGGFQQATRAPNTAEMFQGPIMLTVPFAPSDPCTFTTAAPWGNVASNPRRLEVQQLCIDLIGNPNTPFGGIPGTPAANTFVRPGVAFFPLENVLEAGQPNLIAETADTWTFGIVFSGPGNFENLTASIDAYNIEMTDAIARLNPVFVYEQCFNANGVSNPTLSINDPGGYCKLIGRQPLTGERDTVDTPFVNQGALKTSGVDLAVNWAADLDNGGSFYINSLVSVLNEYQVQDSPTEPFREAKGTLAEGGQYEYRLNNTFGYNFGGGRANVGLRWTHLPEVKDAAALRPPTRVLPVDSYNLFSLFAGYQISERLSLRGGIDNLLDEDPPVVGRDPGTNPSLGCPGSPSCNNNSANTNAQYYDVLGRRAYVALKMNF